MIHMSFSLFHQSGSVDRLVYFGIDPIYSPFSSQMECQRSNIRLRVILFDNID